MMRNSNQHFSFKYHCTKNSKFGCNWDAVTPKTACKIGKIQLLLKVASRANCLMSNGNHNEQSTIQGVIE